MRRPFRSFFTAAAAALVALAASAPVQAERLERVGTKPDEPHDAIAVDLDSIRLSGPYRIALIVNVYTAPRSNIRGVTMDRHAQRTAFDCDAQTFSPIVEIGYLNGKQIGHGEERPDWRTKFIPLPDDPLAQAVIKTVCSASVTTESANAAPGPVYIPAGPAGPAGSAAPAASAPVTSKMSVGSGIVVNDEGYVLTDARVVDGCKVVVAEVKGFGAVPARVVAVDPKTDLALLMTRARYGAPAVFRSEARPVKLGERVAAPGYLLPGVLSEAPEASFGEVSSVAALGDDNTLLQFSAPVPVGDNGGAVFDRSGQVIGVVASQASQPLAANIGTIPQNMNVAIKGERAQTFMTAHEVRFATDGRDRKLETKELAELGEKSTAEIACMK